ncbi:hypothetical protein G210_0753, partial [Candida maltosa Xu316]
MSSVRKIQGYQERKETLSQQYSSLKDAFKGENDYAGLVNVYEMLKHLDELVYQFHVYKSYLESTKKPLTLAQNAEMKSIENLIKTLEDDVSLSYITENANRLAIIRREIFENAREGGRLLYAVGYKFPAISSGQTITSAGITKPKSKPQQKPKPQSKPKTSTYTSARYMKWSKRCTQIVLEAANMSDKYVKQKHAYLVDHFKQEFGVACTKDFVHYLFLHYIDGETSGFNEAFDECYVKHQHPSIEKRAVLIAEEMKANRSPDFPAVHDYVYKYGIWLREIFERTYGQITEPATNFQ